MFVILCYDVEQKRVKKAMNICRQYLTHVQESVFEGSITEGKLKELQKKLKGCLTPQADSVIIYEMDSTRYCQKQCFGTKSFQQESILYEGESKQT